MGPYLPGYILNDFGPTLSPTASQSIFNTMFGIALTMNMDLYFNTYELGMRSVGTVRNRFSVLVLSDVDK